MSAIAAPIMKMKMPSVKSVTVNPFQIEYLKKKYPPPPCAPNKNTKVAMPRKQSNPIKRLFDFGRDVNRDFFLRVKSAEDAGRCRSTSMSVDWRRIFFWGVYIFCR